MSQTSAVEDRLWLILHPSAFILPFSVIEQKDLGIEDAPEHVLERVSAGVFVFASGLEGVSDLRLLGGAGRMHETGHENPPCDFVVA
jgi:hypothetical protein